MSWPNTRSNALALPSETMFVLKSWFSQRKYTDIVFFLEDKKKRRVEIRAHKIVLASRSPFLEQLLYGHIGSVRSLEDDCNDFLDFLNYLYTNSLEPETLLGTFKCAMKYKVCEQ
jgi:hypothetical protein